MITKSLGILSQETLRAPTESLKMPVLVEQHFWTPGRRIKCWVVYFKIPAETVPSSKSCCAWKPSVQTSGFMLALISTYVVVSSGTLPAECSQPPRKSSGTV